MLAIHAEILSTFLDLFCLYAYNIKHSGKGSTTVWDEGRLKSELI